jgi:serine protease Do
MHMNVARLLTAGLLLSTWQTSVLRADPTRSEIQHAVDAVYPALVRIHVVAEQGGEGRMQKLRASGSGTIITKDGYILTNHHVAGRATRIVCRLSDREEVDAELIGTDPLCDLAILKLNLATRRDPKAPLATANFGDSDKLKVGDAVLAMGSPAGLSQSVTKGIVANTAMISPGNSGGMTLDGEHVGELVRWIGHDAVIFPGNSGGPLVNLKGEIVGVNEVGIGSLGGAIPSNLAQAVAKELIAKHSVSRSWIGLEPQPLLKEMNRDKGLLVAAVYPDSPAKLAGIQPGDFITHVNTWTVPDSRSPEDLPVFNRVILTSPAGSTLTLKGVRAGKPMTWKVTTVEREPNVAREIEIRNWGLTVRDFTRVSALKEHRKDKNGVIVDSVRPGGPCAESKPALANGDIILKAAGQPIANTQALLDWTRAFTKGLAEPKPVLVTFEHGNAEWVTVAKIGPEPDEPKPQSPSKAWLGVETQVLTRDLAEALGVERKKGVRVTKVLPNSTAEKAGVKVGDLFLKLDGQVIAASTPSDDELFDNLIRQYKVGSEAEIEGVRDTQPLKLAITLGKTPKPTGELAEYKDDLFEFSAREMSVNDRADAHLPVEEPSVRVSSVKSAGWAALAGLGVGDVLRSVDSHQISTVADLKSVMAAIAQRKPERIMFFVQHGILTRYVELEPKW